MTLLLPFSHSFPPDKLLELPYVRLERLGDEELRDPSDVCAEVRALLGYSCCWEAQ